MRATRRNSPSRRTKVGEGVGVGRLGEVGGAAQRVAAPGFGLVVHPGQHDDRQRDCPLVGVAFGGLDRSTAPAAQGAAGADAMTRSDRAAGRAW
jgi:hypothetical protein